MGKSAASCFKIIACGSDSVDHGDLQTPESKGSNDRRGWSFRKRSARHRVLSNSVISEAPSTVNKENPESAAVNFQVPADLTVPEKNSVIQWTEEKTTEEKTELPAQLNSNLSETLATRENNCGADGILDEASIIIIQAGIRGLLAQRVLLKQKNIIKLQAVVRGHLVRSYAVGTLRCVQAIIKMQSLVRARRARLHVKGLGSGDFAKQSESSERDDNDLTLLGMKEAKPNGRYTYVSIEKLLSNAFARQLMESSPRTNRINIKCDPSKSDSAWKWLERWMSVSSVCNEELQDPESALEQHKEHLGYSDGKEDILVPSGQYSEPTGFRSGLDASAEASENDDNLISYDTNNIDLRSSKSISPSSSHSNLHIVDQSHSRCDVTESAPIEMKETGMIEAVEVKSLPKKEETGNGQDIPVLEMAPTEQSGTEPKKCSTEQPETETKKFSTEQPETEVKVVEVKSLPKKEETRNGQDIPVLEMAPTEQSGTEPKKCSTEQLETETKKFSTEQPETEVKKISKKAGNPAFIAAQSKFEELSLAATSAKSATSSSHEPGADTEQPSRSRDIGLADNAISNASAAHIVGSECGTELSISSTLDSPDRSEVGANDVEQETKVSDETDHPRGRETLELEANEKSIIREANPSYTKTDKLDRYDSINSTAGESLNSITAADSPNLDKKPEADPSNLQLELGPEASHQVNNSSPGGSPRSHITVPESQATPSSQVSVKTKKSKGEKSDSNRKKKASSADKNLSNRNQDSASRSSLEQIQEHKTGKRRNSSFGSAKPDHREQEPRDSSSSNSLPSYMQATESARAKTIANGSPRSSPDVHDKDIYLKKRHSLPGTNERQGSPRIQRSVSQAQQNAKGNGTCSPQGTQDRKWRR